ncbi:centrosomal protein of 131 kDa [Pectinophora gossypiella]|uniref:centrosomal protein of 131 kDa n=1 Tax=Pectinophora gossypiella TaxID=13191 RepID=UPI00214EC484|nr:centrosomal protein of 131 kDa [Pectinophora gossypiella]
MSKDNPNLRLLGSPVNLSYRSKKKDDRKNIRNRPRSALQNSGFTPDTQERFKRPFSADTKERPPSTRSFFNTFSSDLLQYSDYPITTIKIVPPTTELLGDTKSVNNQTLNKDKEICSNASDYGSEDTFISLGTKIKARAQLGPKPKTLSNKNTLKYRNIAKKAREQGRKQMDGAGEDKPSTEYGLEVKITERPQRVPSPSRSRDLLERSPSFKRRSYDSYFIPLDMKRKDEDIAGRVSFGSSNIQAEVEQAIDTYSRRLTLTKQQLSLVEEESTQDIESTSQRMSSLSPEDTKKDEMADDNLTGRNTYVVDSKDEDYPNTQNFINEPKTYNSFYDDFHSTSLEPFKTKLSSTAIATDSSSKDSGYPDSGANDDKNYRHNYSLPSTSQKKSNSQNKILDQPKSLDSISSNNSNDKNYHKTFPLDKNSQWAEPLNHSRLLYKDFFLKKEGHVALPPQNSPNTTDINIPAASEIEAVEKTENDNENSDYPSYLLNSSTKAYTSKVIEDYKKELEAINNLHELTLKDIKTDAISPTPLNIDKMFEQHSSFSEDKLESSENSQDSNIIDIDKNKNSLDATKSDISKVSTKELIQNYLKVKEGDYSKDYLPKSMNKYDRKLSNAFAKAEASLASFKQDWNNKNTTTKTNTGQMPKAVNIRNQTQKNLFTLRAPMSARIESVQNDKDIDSWMSLSAPSPRLLDIDHHADSSKESHQLAQTTAESNSPRASSSPKRADTIMRPVENLTPATPASSATNISVESESYRVKELNPKSTVLDIYSMLKEIESYGDNPVTSVSRADIPETPETEVKEERPSTPKDNFTEIFEFLEKVEQSANDALNVVTTSTPQTIPKLEALLKLPQTELAQRLVTASLQLEERSCCIALLQESLTNHKEQMISKVSTLEKQSHRNIAKVKQECEETIKRHQNFIDQLINDKKTLNHRIEQLVDERRSLEERWKRSAQALEERYKLELRNQHDKMAAAQQVARQRWVRQKAEKIKELTVKGLEGELREMAERQQKEISDLKMFHAEQTGRMQAKHASELEELRRTLEEEKESALIKERQLASSRLEKQILELELTYQEQRTRLVAEMRAENDRLASALGERERTQRDEIEKWKEEQEALIAEKRMQMEQEIAKEKERVEESMQKKQEEMEQKFEQYKKEFEAEQQVLLKKKVTEISAQHKMERDREIERAIESMEAEAQAGRKELQEALRRNKEQYEAELKELGETEQATLRRYQDAQARIRHTEDRCAELEVTISQLETRNKILTEKNIQLEQQSDEVRARSEQAWASKVDALRREMEDMRRTHEEQMHQLYAKVKVAVARKDSAIQALTREAAKYQEKIAVLEQKLQQQRKDFLKHK